MPKIATQPNIVVSKTFSKVRAAAGLRLGVLVANLELAAHYRAVQLPYNINVITSAVAAKIVPDFLERLRSPQPRALFAALQILPRAVELQPFRRVVGLHRARDFRIGDLDPPPVDHLGRARRSPDGDERRPARVGPQPDRGATVAQSRITWISLSTEWAGEFPGHSPAVHRAPPAHCGQRPGSLFSRSLIRFSSSAIRLRIRERPSRSPSRGRVFSRSGITQA